MPLSTSAKPPLSAWIIRERKRMKLKPEDIASRLTAMGLPIEVGTVRTWEAGRRPKPDNIEGLERIFGVEAPGQPTADAELVVALASQTAAISDLVLLLRPVVAEAVDREVRLRAVEAELALGGRPGAARSPTRRAPQARAR